MLQDHSATVLLDVRNIKASRRGLTLGDAISIKLDGIGDDVRCGVACGVRALLLRLEDGLDRLPRDGKEIPVQG
jgi:hypothetical protein